MSLKQDKKPPRLQPPAVRLFIGDLQQLHDLAAPKLEASLHRADDYTADTPADLAELTERTGKRVLKSLRVSWRLRDNSALHINFAPQGAISGFIDRQLDLELAHEVLNFLGRHQRSWVSRFLSRIPSRAGGMLFGIGAGLPLGVLMRALTTRFVDVIFGGALMAIYLALSAIAYAYLFGPRIHLYRRSDHQGLFGWADAKSVIISVVTALATAVALLASQKLTGWSLN
jgi:hypothetical protein